MDEEFNLKAYDKLYHIAQDMFNNLSNKIIPKKYDIEMLNSSYSMMFSLRRFIIDTLGFVMLSWEWLEPFINWIGSRRCLEIMAGCGSFSYALNKKGIDIISTDDFSWHNHWKDQNNMWYNVENMDCIEAIQRYGRDVDLIICGWALMDDSIYRSLIEMRKVNSDCMLIFIGEYIGGCTGNDEFFKEAIEIDDKNFYESVQSYRTWTWLHDYPRLYK